MSPLSSPLLLGDAREFPQLQLADFAAQCLNKLQGGARLLTLIGRPDASNQADGFCVTAVFQSAPGTPSALSVLRAQASAGQSYPALTCSFPAAQSHERELWEQTGLMPQGHPWLKPIRFEGARQQHMADYPFFNVRGQEVHEVGVGPIHASVIEPGHFRFMCLGEQVHHLEIQLGYQHRGVETLLLRRPPLALTPLMESICGDLPRREVVLLFFFKTCLLAVHVSKIRFAFFHYQENLAEHFTIFITNPINLTILCCIT